MGFTIFVGLIVYALIYLFSEGSMFAFTFAMVAAIEREHEARYKKLLANIEGDLVFSSENDCIWICRNCGHIVVGKKAPALCPVCNHPQAYFEVRKVNY